jgi:DNA-binding Lrp family transcriptional regulator
LENILVERGVEISSKPQEDQAAMFKRSAFVFITTDSASGSLALADLKRIDGVKEVYRAHGAYDVVAKVTGESFDTVKEIVHKRIKNLNGVKSTLTLTLI